MFVPLEGTDAWGPPPERHHRLTTLTHPWQIGLPANWRECVVVPFRFDIYWEYQVDAARVLGCDASGAPCYSAHRYVLTRLRYEEDEIFYEVIAYRDERFAWLLQDGQWLVRHTVTSHEDCDHSASSVFLTNQMPR